MFDFADGISFLAEEACVQTWAFCAKKGAGKTYAAMKLGEGLLEDGQQIVVLDPLGVWYGLRIAGNVPGGRGFDVPVFGGEHGDVALAPSSGATVADIIVSTNTSVILDVSHFRIGQRKEFVTAFAEELFHLKKKARSPVCVFFEETQVFAPQKPQKGEERMLGAIEAIVRLGRNYGLGAVMISQRPQSVNKEVLSQAEILVALQTNGAHERAAIDDWISQNVGDAEVDIDSVLPSLAVGEALAWSPQWLRTFRRTKIKRRVSADTSATPTKATRRTAPAKLSDEHLDRLREQMKDVEEEATKNDPKRLRARIAELEKQLTSPRVPAGVSQVSIEEHAREREELAAEREIVESERTAVARAMAVLRGAQADIAKIDVRFVSAVPADVAPARVIASPPPRLSVTPPRQLARVGAVEIVVPSSREQRGTKKSAAKDDSLKGVKLGARRILAALASYDPAPLTRDQVALLAELSPRSGSFGDYLSVLRRREFIVDVVGGKLALASAGRELVVHVPRAQHNPQKLLELWLPKFKAGARRMLEAVVANPGGITRQDLAEAAEMTGSSGSFGDYLSVLRRSGLIVDVAGGIIEPAPLLIGRAA